jgi:UDP-N-acetylglucosamine diphosphorylase/glucosamine-1-phosphate N-acetyltransferase
MKAALRLFAFDDARSRAWAPFALTRPVGELLHGCMTLRERIEHAFGVRCEGHVVGEALAGFDEPGAPAAVTLERVGTHGRRVLVSSRAALDLEEVDLPDRSCSLTVSGTCVGWVVADGEPLPSPAWLDDPTCDVPARGGPVAALSGTLLDRPWDLVAQNPERVRRDLELLWPQEDAPAGSVRIGTGVFSVAEGSVIEPGVFVDTSAGPVRISEGVRVHGPARLVGPLFVGPGSRILGGNVGTSTIGPVSIVRGEVADSIFLGYTNKAHDGYIGHTLVGRWVNLGAFTTNSDLKNDYGSVTVWTPDGEMDSGLTKVGCFLGDHVKTGIGTLLNTGTVIGAGSNVFGGIMPPTMVPPFSWGSGSNLSQYRLQKFFQTAERAMARRSQQLTPGVRAVLERASGAAAVT